MNPEARSSRVRGFVVLLLVALVLPLSGCFAPCEAPPPVSARGVSATAPQSAGDGSAAFAVEVREEGPSGKPIAGAGVVFFWGDETSRDRSALVAVGPDGAIVQAPGASVAIGGIPPPAYTTTLELRTDAEGHAVGKLPAGRIAGVVVAAPGYTEETVRAFATGGSGTRALRVPLYHDHLVLGAQGAIGPGALSTAVVPVVGTVVWYPQQSLFSPAYLDRLVRLELHLNWTNGPTAFADLGLGLGRTSSAIDRLEDSRFEVAPGSYSQALSMGLDELDQLDFTGADQVLAGPATSTGYLAPFNLGYTLSWTGTFETASAFQSQCGLDLDGHHASFRATAFPVAPFAVALLLLVAAVARRN